MLHTRFMPAGSLAICESCPPMKRSRAPAHWLARAANDSPATELPTGEAFRSEWIDFEHGVRVGNLLPHERITQILRFHLEGRHGTRFITDRWGRGVFWQWICWLPRANREAKPVSNKVNFGCAKFFISADQETHVFKAGLQVERGFLTGPEAEKNWGFRDDWDWCRLMDHCHKGSELDRELHRLLEREGFVVETGDWDNRAVLNSSTFRSASQIAAQARKCPGDKWAGFQLYYPLPEAEVRACSGSDLVQAIRGAFTEVTPAMNCCMQIQI